jgi:hypothetical protein
MRQRTLGFQCLDGGRIGGILVDVYDTGLPDASMALTRKRFAAAASRFAVNRNSIVWPVESTARYSYRSWPLILI